LDERRDKAIIGLTGAIDGYCYHFDTDTVNAADTLATNLKLYGSGIAKLNFPTESATLAAIINDWETKPKLVAAITKLGLAAWVAELKAANQLFGQKFLERTQEFGAANPDTLRVKREETLAAYYELRKFIDANSVINPSAAYDKLIKELNALIDQYNGLLSSRLAEPATEPAPVNN
jgi:predicted DNA-binding transcriptional regulator YafY